MRQDVFLKSFITKSETAYLCIPFLWYALASTRAIGRWVPGYMADSQISFTEGSPIDRVVYAILILFGIIVLLNRRFNWKEAVRSNKWVFALIFYALLSISWSNFPEVAIKRWIKLFGSAVMVFIILSGPTPVISISSLLRMCFLIHIPLDVVFVKYIRALGVGWDGQGLEMWTGLTTHKNVLGQVCMTAGLYFVWDIFKKPSKGRMALNIVYLFMLVYLMNGPGYSRSATAMFCLFVGIIVFLWIQYAPRDPELLNRYFIKFACSVFFLIAFSQLGIFFFTENRSIGEVTIEMSGRDSTLTGRTDLWEDILKYASINPFTGVGYGSFWIGNLSHNLWDKHFWHPEQGHNGYIDVYVELGMIGLFLFGGLLISAFRKIKSNIVANFEYGCFQISMFIMIIIHNLAETSFLRGDVDLWFMFLLVSLNIQHPDLESPPADWYSA